MLFLIHRHITNVQLGHRRCRHHHPRHRGCRGSGVHSAGNGRCLHCRLRCRRLGSSAATGNSGLPRRPLLLLILRGHPDLLLVGGVTVPPSKIRVHSSHPPPLLLVQKAPLLLVRKVYCCVRRTGSDIVNVIISSRIAVVIITSPHSPPRSATFSEPLPNNGRYVACLDRSWEGEGCKKRVLKHLR